MGFQCALESHVYLSLDRKNGVIGVNAIDPLCVVRHTADL